MNTPILKLLSNNGNIIFIKRDDLLPFSFGGNKARKAVLFIDDFDNGNYDTIVTYGSSSSNHCRIISNYAASKGIECYIISPQEKSLPTFNSKLMNLFGAKIICIPVEHVHDTIENTITELRINGKKPYFIPGGGHGNIGTQAYVNCYDEIKEYEAENNIHFDYIFHASGTGTTQAGLVCGSLINNDDRKIIGISIARKNPYGRNVVLESVKSYLKSKNKVVDDTDIYDAVNFIDEYITGGYAVQTEGISELICKIITKHGIPLDPIYTGKAFYGMYEYLNTNKIINKNILFIHTGGMPLFFDFIEKQVF